LRFASVDLIIIVISRIYVIVIYEKIKAAEINKSNGHYNRLISRPYKLMIERANEKK
jgi:hypothetical protein